MMPRRGRGRPRASLRSQLSWTSCRTRPWRASVPEVLLTADQAAGEQARVAGGCAGLRRGDRLVLTVPGCPRLVTAVMGALRVGIVPVVLDPATPPTELHALIDDADPALVIDSMAALDELHAHAPGELAPVPLGRPMHVTSGTTGRRKGVTSGVLEAPAAAALWAEETQLWGFVGSDVHLVVSPLYHSAPLRFAIGTLLAGGTIVVPGRFNPAEFGDLAQRYRPTTMFTAPAQLQRLRELADPRATAALRSFRLIAHAGAPCPEPVKRWLLDVVAPEAVWEFYGCTEGQFTACSAADWLAHPGTVGRARPGRTLSTDPDGTIWCTVPAHARFSYWRAPEKTAAAWRDTPQGPAFTVGDLGRLDAEGWLYLDGRREDLVITGGGGERVPGRGGAGTGAVPGGAGSRGLRGGRRSVGPAGGGGSGRLVGDGGARVGAAPPRRSSAAQGGAHRRCPAAHLYRQGAAISAAAAAGAGLLTLAHRPRLGSGLGCGGSARQ